MANYFKIENNVILDITKEGREELGNELVIPEGIVGINRILGEFKILILPKSLKFIGDQAFRYTGLAEIRGGENVEEIKKFAFEGNLLTDISNFKNLKIIGNSAFRNNHIEFFKAPKSLKKIEPQAFVWNDIEAVNLEETEGLEVDDYAFQNNKIETLYMAKDTSVGSYVFGYNRLKNIKGGGNIHQYAFNLSNPIAMHGKKPAFLSIWQKEDFRINENKITGLSKEGEVKLDALESLTIPHFDGVDEIGRYAFQSVIAPAVYIDEGYKCIRAYAFSHVTIHSIRLPETLKRIEDNAFEESNLLSIEIPKNVRYIGAEAFTSSSLTYIDMSKSKIESIEQGTFAGCEDLVEVLFPPTLESIQYEAFLECASLREVTLPKNFGCVAQSAFSVSSINVLNIEDGAVIEIGNEAFKDTSLSEINGDFIFSEIGKSAFYGTSLKELNLKDTKKIDEYAFRDTPLEKIQIKGDTEVCAYAFYTTNLKEVSLEGNFDIGVKAFSNGNIKHLKIEDSEFYRVQMSYEAFGTNSLKKIVLPECVTTIHTNTFQKNPIKTFELSENTEIK